MLGRAWSVTLFALLVGLTPHFAHAEGEDAGTLGAPFLKIPIGAKVMAVPDVVAALQPDASLMFSNPAAVAGIPTNELFVTTANWLDDVNLSAISAAFPIGSRDLRWSLGTRLLSSNNLQGLNASNQVVSETNYYDVAFTTGIAKSFSNIGLALGGDVTYVRQHLPEEDGDGVTLSLGASYAFGANRVDAFARDLGGKLSYADRDYDIDSQYMFGYTRRFNQSWGIVHLGGQVAMSQSDYRRVRIGAAYLMNQHFTFRAGLDQTLDATTSESTPITAGMGVHYGSFYLDYAFTSQEYFASRHTFSVVFEWGKAYGSAGQDAANMSQSGQEPSAQGSSAAKAGAAAGAAAATTKAVTGTEEPGGVASYTVVAGVHSNIESARSEVRALRLLNIPAFVETDGTRYRVVIARFESRKDAEQAVEKYRKEGHVFTVTVDQL
jgi:K+-transporting ATPase c subunit